MNVTFGVKEGTGMSTRGRTETAGSSLHYGTATARMHWCMFPPQNIATPSSRSKTTKAPPLNRLLATIVPRRAVSTRHKNSECWLNLGVLKIKPKKPPNPHCNHQASIAAIVPRRAADAGKTPTWLKCKREISRYVSETSIGQGERFRRRVYAKLRVLVGGCDRRVVQKDEADWEVYELDAAKRMQMSSKTVFGAALNLVRTMETCNLAAPDCSPDRARMMWSRASCDDVYLRTQQSTLRHCHSQDALVHRPFFRVDRQKGWATNSNPE
ncbi:hypothetical protein C8R43DRAFT_1197724 [Mycena crocata]|nr:hypothetical protein C8R43DRAFT_1197724 [Mycena crocata]